MPHREPAVWITFFAGLVQLIWMLWSGDVNATAEWAMPAVTMLAGIIIRQKVMPVSTVKDAGLSPAEVKAAAEDPRVEPFVEK